jgi:nitrite reductase (NADH) small subunit
MKNVTVAPLSAIPAGEGRTFQIGSRRLAIFHTRCGGVYATQADCPHKQGPLADGLVGGCVLICPLHSWKFDLANGQALLGDCSIETYPAYLDTDNRIVVTLPT